jgi:two-component system, chemotaxis family, response regulator Rcp1
MERSASQRLTKILLAEDNPLDVRLIRYALQHEQNWMTEVVVAEDGEKAIQYLMQQNSSPNGTNPDLVILDLNLPKMDGTEVLQVIRTTKGLQSLPVVVVSSSPEEISEGIVRQANVEANGYLMKPINIDEFLALGAVFRRVMMQTQNVRRVDGHTRPSERGGGAPDLFKEKAFRGEIMRVHRFKAGSRWGNVLAILYVYWSLRLILNSAKLL